jgi:hypothetical protein
MANTDPVADTAGVVEQVWRLGQEAGLVDVVPVGAVTVGLTGERLAELGAMADSAARVRVFSDDGKCVSDPALMRRALEYVKAFDGVVAQHAEEPRLTEGAQMHEGDRSARLGLTGWPAAAEEAIIARDVLLAGHVGARLHVCHVSTAGSVELLRWAKSRGVQVTAEVTPHHLLLTDACAESYDPVFKVNPPLRTDATSRLSARAWPTARSTPSPPTTPRTRWRTRRASGPGPARHARAGAGALGRLETMVETGLLDWPGSPTGCRSAPRSSAGWTGTAARWPPVSRPTSCCWTPRPGRRRPGSAGQPQPQQPLRRPGAPGPGGRDVPAGRPDRPRRKGTALTAILVLEDGRTFRGEAYGAIGTTVGEAVFATGMTGYQETLTDPSYHRQVVVMTAPHIGNTGVNGEDDESSRMWVAGFVVRDPARRPSNWRSTGSLDDELVEQGVVGISGVDTRALTRHLRDRGAMRAGISSVITDPDELLARVAATPEGMVGATSAPTVSHRRGLRSSRRSGDGALHHQRAGTSHQDRHPAVPGRAQASIRTCCPRLPRRGSAAWPPPRRRLLSNGPVDPAAADYAVRGVQACSTSRRPLSAASASATRSSAARWAWAPTSCASATAGSTSRCSTGHGTVG